jgi:hypothetical protein
VAEPRDPRGCSSRVRIEHVHPVVLRFVAGLQRNMDEKLLSKCKRITSKLWECDHSLWNAITMKMGECLGHCMFYYHCGAPRANRGLGSFFVLVSSHDGTDHNLNPDVPTLSQFNKKAVENFSEAFELYASHVIAVERGERPSNSEKKFNISDLTENKHGLPLVPEKVESSSTRETAFILKDIVRSFFNKHYGEAVFLKYLFLKN